MRLRKQAAGKPLNFNDNDLKSKEHRTRTRFLNPLPRWCRIWTVICAVLIALFLWSLDYRFGYSGRPMPVGFSHGALWLGEINTPDRGGGWFIAPNQSDYILWLRFSVSPPQFDLRLILPLCIPIALITAACAVGVFKSINRTREGHCPCGYNLTGNESGVCPECGTEIQV